MRQLFAFLAVVALSCTPMPERPCDRFQVAADGTVNNFPGAFGGGFAGGFAGGFGGGSASVGASPIHLEGEALSVRLVAPLTSCSGDTLRVSVEVLAPDSSPVANTFTEPLRAGDSHVETRVEFTPNAPGLYVVRAVFEPSLGVRTATMNVISTFVESRATAIPVPNVTCAKFPWPVSSDTVACELSSGQISLLSSDGGVATFPGSALVVVDDVLWSETATHVLERREYVDGGLTLTASVQGFSADPVRGLHTRSSALRRRDNGLLGAVLSDGGLLETSFSTTDFESGLFFLEPTDSTVRVANSFACGNCLNSLVAFDDAMAWQQFGSGSVVSGFKRPITVMTPFSAPAFMLAIEARTTTPPLEPLERWPLWVDPSSRPTVSILIRPRSGALEWSSWPRGRVVRVGNRHAVLVAPSGFLVAPLDR